MSAKLPVKHIPMAPTPGPPHCSWASRASARSHRVTGLDSLAANGAELGADAGALQHRDAFLGSGDGAVAAEQRRHVHREACVANPAAKRATCGLMPGISVITITAGPVPAT